MSNELTFRVIFSVLWIIFIANLLWVRYSARARPERHTPDRAARRQCQFHVLALAIFGPFWFGGIILYMVLPSWIAFLSIPLPDWFRFVMAGVTALSIPFTIWGYRTIGKNWVHALDPLQFREREEENLVTTGPYRYVRNPIYLGAFTLIIALALLAANWLLLLPAFFLVSLIYGQIDGEEVMLMERFGDEYREYMKRTPRIIPRLGHQAGTEEHKRL